MSPSSKRTSPAAAAPKAARRGVSDDRVKPEAPAPGTARLKVSEAERLYQTSPKRSADLQAAQVDAFLEAVERQVHLEPRQAQVLRSEFKRLLAQALGSQRLAGRPQPLIDEGDEVLTTQQAAELLGVSRPFVAARIDSGDIPLFQQVGNQRRVLASAVRSWHANARGRQREAMRELAAHLDDELEA